MVIKKRIDGLGKEKELKTAIDALRKVDLILSEAPGSSGE